jgi:hypothetical protein
MAAVIYILCAATSLLCALLLLRGWRQSRSGLLLWSGLCFAGLTASNVILVLDRLVYTEADLTTPRLALALAALILLLFGLIWESD